MCNSRVQPRIAISSFQWNVGLRWGGRFSAFALSTFLGVCFLGGSAAPSFANAAPTDAKKWRLRMALPNFKERLSLTADLLDKRQLETAAP